MKREWAGVSKTAHFTAAVWQELGVPGAARFVTRQGQFLNWIVRWGGGLFGLRGQYSVVNLFLAPRHLGLNALLPDRNPSRIIELAAGLSSRGLEWVQTHPGIYTEVDQPSLIAAKKRLLAALLPQFPGYKLIAADLIKDDLSSIFGSQLLDEILREQAGSRKLGGETPPLQPVPNENLGGETPPLQIISNTLSNEELGGETPPLPNTATPIDPYSSLITHHSSLIICEGMTGYLGEGEQRRLLRMIRELAENFEDCRVLMDFYLRLDYKPHGRVYLAMLPARLLWRVLRAPMQMFLRDAQDIRTLLTSEGFEIVRLYSAQELAKLAGTTPPPLNLFYLAEFRLVC